MLNKREFKVILTGKKKGKMFDSNDEIKINYDGGKQMVKL